MHLRFLAVLCAVAASGCAVQSPASSCPDIPIAPKDGLRASLPESFKVNFPAGTHRRTDEEINGVFYKIRVALNQMYVRAWRENPCIGAGVINVAIAIQPNGAVAAAQVVNSQMNDAGFERKIEARIKLMEFPPANGDGYYVFLYPIRFYPS